MLTWMMICVAVGFAQPAHGPAERELSTPQFAHAFIETQPVQVAVAAGDAQPVLLRDSDGTEVARREATGDAGVLDFGPLPPGYYEAVAGQNVLPLVVLIDPAKRVGGGSRLATDNAMSWLVEASQWEPVARLLQQCGIRCVRERLSWGEVERQRGRYDWGRYDRTATILHEHGIEVYQIFHSVPAWSRSDKDPSAAPDDLRDVYRFAQSLATLTVSSCGRYASVAVTQAMYDQAQAGAEHTDGFVNYPRSVRGVEVAIFFRQVSPTSFKVGFRSKGSIDVGALSREFGGGGHHNAAGAVVDGTLDEVRATVSSRLDRLLAG